MNLKVAAKLGLPLYSDGHTLHHGQPWRSEKEHVPQHWAYFEPTFESICIHYAALKIIAAQSHYFVRALKWLELWLGIHQTWHFIFLYEAAELVSCNAPLPFSDSSGEHFTFMLNIFLAFLPHCYFIWPLKMLHFQGIQKNKVTIICSCFFRGNL